MKNILICTPVMGSTIKEFLSNLEKIQQISDFVELRTDYIRHLKVSDVEIIRKNTTKKAIFSLRKKNEGGQTTLSEAERVAIFNKAIQLKFDFVDIEFATLKDHNIKVNKHVKIIASYHNFLKTNPFSTLGRMIDEIDHAQVDIIKIATMIKSENDIKTLLRLLIDPPTKKDVIIMGMGQKGRITRIISPLLGGFLTYASTAYSHTAPGQIDLDELKNIYKTVTL